MNIVAKQNPRNVVIVTPLIVLKYRRDWNLRKIFWEFALTWKASLHKLSSIPVLIGPVLLRKTTNGTILAKKNPLECMDGLIRAVAMLSAAGIDHKELRHPQYHMFIEKNGQIRIIDFERGSLTGAPRNLSRFIVWLLERGAMPEEVERILQKLENVPETDRKGASKAIAYWKLKRGNKNR